MNRPLVVGIVNVTPDSFSGDGVGDDLARAVEHGLRQASAGADWLDIGGESTRPGASHVSEDEERDRVVPLIERLRSRVDLTISVDTRRASVAEEALHAGATVVNDVSGFKDPRMACVVAKHRAQWVLMHMPHAVGEMGWSEAVSNMPATCKDGCARVVTDLADTVERAVTAGVPREALLVDPGLGFGKSLAQNLAFLRGPQGLDRLGLPVFMGPSRKSFIGAVTGAEVGGRVWGTAAAVTACVLWGASHLRVHDVAEMAEVIRVATAIRDGVAP